MALCIICLTSPTPHSAVSMKIAAHILSEGCWYQKEQYESFPQGIKAVYFDSSGYSLKDWLKGLPLFHLTSTFPRTEVASQVAFIESI